MYQGQRLVDKGFFRWVEFRTIRESFCRISHFAHLKINRFRQVIALNFIALLSPLAEILGSLHAAHRRPRTNTAGLHELLEVRSYCSTYLCQYDSRKKKGGKGWPSCKPSAMIHPYLKMLRNNVVCKSTSSMDQRHTRSTFHSGDTDSLVLWWRF